MIPKKHFICLGCKTVRDKEGVCSNQKCPSVRRPLKECSCPDGKHFGDFEKAPAKKTPPPTNPLDEFLKDIGKEDTARPR